MKNAISIRLSGELLEKLNALAERTGRSKTYYIKEAILTHIEDLEDVYIAEQMMERVRSGKEETISHKELGKSLGLGN